MSEHHPDLVPGSPMHQFQITVDALRDARAEIERLREEHEVATTTMIEDAARIESLETALDAIVEAWNEIPPIDDVASSSSRTSVDRAIDAAAKLLKEKKGGE